MSRIFKYLFCIAFFFNTGYYVFSQTRIDLEKERRKTQNDLEYATNLLKSTQDQRKSSVENYIITNKKIELRTRNIQNIKGEILQIESNIATEQQVISGLKSDLDKLRTEYVKLVMQAFKTFKTSDKLMYIFASKDFNQAYRRLRYLHYYSKYRKSQIQSIEATQTVLQKRVMIYEELKDSKQHLLTEVSKETNKLSTEKKQQEKLLKSLSSKEKQLKAEIAKKEKLAKKLQQEIERIIAEEIAKSKKGAKIYQLTPQEQILNDQFSSNLNKLPWPLERGIITENFGEHNHPVLKGIIIRNDGIDISTAKGSAVRSVFNGTVRNVFIIPGMNKVVIVRHGSYLSVYSNLIDVYVKAGEDIKTKQVIGILAANENSDVSILKFQIWKENVKLDPQKWLAKEK
ncbi:MAG: peptidoglycan DD-metalloendopeptidase family protein [Salinivirgaceae bacterium]|nr:peptidoglycan DD-metalloendopeptidase family protein [Salinivirgaceae bacterium]MDD4746056.1 peptidoglycan DD-metalloendopeptidase family protein [Salinivirgaceae bacterium]MDY0279328.1 peptidoglycan DD-metalloendopeptidase family protein [Salinivirgaceae bacterium]